MRSAIVRLGSSGDHEWRLLEVQGTLSVDDEGVLKDGIDVGTLNQVDGVYQLLVGNHLLEGREVALKKTFAVMDREDDNDFSVTGFIRKKIVFKSRPKPVMKKIKIFE